MLVLRLVYLKKEEKKKISFINEEPLKKKKDPYKVDIFLYCVLF